ncbi:MAG: hypothetical protein FDZ69_10660 [Deltaproteobacteria bacterium]|nr:MAG: hypothetical protein FDZ69_10660 [Deltaproteobacteria bacterium]
MDADLLRRLHRALTADGEELYLVLQDAAGEVLRSALKNRHLGEDHLLALLKRRDLGEELLKAVYQLPITTESHRLQVALVRNPGTPGPVVLALLPHLHLFELVDLCYFPGVTPDQKFAAERAILQRLPTTELGNKMTVARRATATVVGEILREGDPPLVEICLASPHLREVAILQFLNGATATAETIAMVARHPRWQARPNLRLAILRNHRTPDIWFHQFLPGMRTPDIRNLLVSKRLNPAQKRLVEEELKRRGGR